MIMILIKEVPIQTAKFIIENSRKLKKHIGFLGMLSFIMHEIKNKNELLDHLIKNGLERIEHQFATTKEILFTNYYGGAILHRNPD